VRRCLVIGIVCLASADGCDRLKAQLPTAKAPAPTTAPVPSIAIVAPSTINAVEAADITPPGCVMIIDHHPIQFPQALLRIHQTDGHVMALLYSDDPKDALDNSYRGNGFYFQLKLDDVADAKFAQATWIHHSETSGRAETPYGIFLDGHRRQLQPLDVRIRLLPSATGGMTAEMGGTFLSVDPQDSLAATQEVVVTARLLADKR
jgi:hypothetical protein